MVCEQVRMGGNAKHAQEIRMGFCKKQEWEATLGQKTSPQVYSCVSGNGRHSRVEPELWQCPEQPTDSSPKPAAALKPRPPRAPCTSLLQRPWPCRKHLQAGGFSPLFGALPRHRWAPRAWPTQTQSWRAHASLTCRPPPAWTVVLGLPVVTPRPQRGCVTPAWGREDPSLGLRRPVSLSTEASAC